MALRNITNNTNLLLKKKLSIIKPNNKKEKMKENEQQQQQLIKIESLTCSPSRKKISTYVRTSSPINNFNQQQHQQQQEMFRIKTNSAAITHLKTLNHESRKTMKRESSNKKYSKSRSRSSKNERKLNSKCNGMLKVALYNNCGLMTVHGKLSVNWLLMKILLIFFVKY